MCFFTSVFFTTIKTHVRFLDSNKNLDFKLVSNVMYIH